MAHIALTLHLAGAVPLALATRANRSTTLLHTLAWAWCAWLAWLLVFSQAALRGSAGDVSVYLALSLTGCAGIGVLGARRPGVGAWNFVLVGLVAVLLLPIAQGLGELRIAPAQVGFLGLLLLVVVLNHLPTRPGTGAFLLGAGCGLQVYRLAGFPVDHQMVMASLALVAATPLAAWAGLLTNRTYLNLLQKEWLRFRDRFGCLWAMRVREQFQRAAANSGKEVKLTWGGHVIPDALAADQYGSLVQLLRATIKRFGVEGW